MPSRSSASTNGTVSDTDSPLRSTSNVARSVTGVDSSTIHAHSCSDTAEKLLWTTVTPPLSLGRGLALDTGLGAAGADEPKPPLVPAPPLVPPPPVLWPPPPAGWVMRGVVVGPDLGSAALDPWVLAQAASMAKRAPAPIANPARRVFCMNVP